ncbi:hypothetical protein J3E68DRAFT_389266 [Trichoderma sp. SZMC 28012]
MDENPIDKTIDKPHGDSLPNTNISANDGLNKTISVAANVDEMDVAEQPIAGLVSKNNQGPQKIAKAVENRRSDQSVLKRLGRVAIITWTCCQCNMGGMLKDTTINCLDLDCQHPRCRNCIVYHP